MADRWRWLMVAPIADKAWEVDGDPGVTVLVGEGEQTVFERCVAAGWEHVPVARVDPRKAIHLFRKPAQA